MEIMKSYKNARLEMMLKNKPAGSLDWDKNSIKEMLQELILYSLAQTNFFDVSAFLGGTALRIFYHLDRFSEDLDFSLTVPDQNFSLDPYIKKIKEELTAFGLNVEIQEKIKKKDSSIQSAFLKTGTREQILTFFPDQKGASGIAPNELLKIKFEIDINPPAGAFYEYKSCLLPRFHRIRTYDPSSLFAGKIHAVLCRPWAAYPKGRDLYDYFFYIQNGIPVNLVFLKNAMVQTGHFREEDLLDIKKLKNMLKEKFSSIDFNLARQDVISFLPFPEEIKDYWNKDVFCEITNMLQEADL